MKCEPRLRCTMYCAQPLFLQKKFQAAGNSSGRDTLFVLFCKIITTYRTVGTSTVASFLLIISLNRYVTITSETFSATSTVSQLSPFSCMQSALHNDTSPHSVPFLYDQSRKQRRPRQNRSCKDINPKLRNDFQMSSMVHWRPILDSLNQIRAEKRL